MTTVLGIDLGTQSVKVVFYDFLARETVAVNNTRGGISKADMVLNDYCPTMEVDPETYEVHADGELLTCEPATELAMAQRYFLY